MCTASHCLESSCHFVQSLDRFSKGGNTDVTHLVRLLFPQWSVTVWIGVSGAKKLVNAAVTLKA